MSGKCLIAMVGSFRNGGLGTALGPLRERRFRCTGGVGNPPPPSTRAAFSTRRAAESGFGWRRAEVLERLADQDHSLPARRPMALTGRDQEYRAGGPKRRAVCTDVGRW